MTIISADLASFYDTVQPEFLVSKDFAAELGQSGTPIPASFARATQSLLGAYERFRDEVSSVLGLPAQTGVPIGALTSRVVANLALASLDSHVQQQSHVLEYRRYVDDIVVVTNQTTGETVEEVLRTILPITAAEDGSLPLDVGVLKRPGSEFHLQTAKSRVHRLSGSSGTDFIRGIQSDFDEVVSRSKAFVDIAALTDKAAANLIRGRTSEGSPLRVLREADRSELERFALATSLRTLERASSMVAPQEVSDLVRSTLKVANQAMTVGDNWVEDLAATLRLLRLALATHDWKSCKDINRRMESVFGTVAHLQKGIGELRYRGQILPRGRQRPWIRLRDYLHRLRLEGCAGALRCDSGVAELNKGFPNGLTVSTAARSPKGLLSIARRLARADLRAFDHEEDSSSRQKGASINPGGIEAKLGEFPDLGSRLRDITAYLDELPPDDPWRMGPATLFLCTRPPSYFDVARRLLADVERHGLTDEKLTKVLAVVNAIRGTQYSNPVARAIASDTVELEPTDPTGVPEGATRVRLVLGNLRVSNTQWEAAAKGKPQKTIRRLVGLQKVLGQAEVASRLGKSAKFPRETLLVLPELSVPRDWLRPVAVHVVRHGGFGAVLGLEYLRSASTVLNQAFAVLPGPRGSVATLVWTKRLPAPHEGEELRSMGIGYSPASRFPPRLVVQTDWGRFSVLICSELLETERVSDLFGRVHLVLCPAWNVDTASYDHLIQSVGFQLHAVVGIANNAKYSDCRAWAPYSERWKRDLCRLIERNVDDSVYVDAPVTELIQFHKESVNGMSAPSSRKKNTDPPVWRPMPPGLADAVRDFEILLDPFKAWSAGIDP